MQFWRLLHIVLSSLVLLVQPAVVSAFSSTTTKAFHRKCPPKSSTFSSGDYEDQKKITTNSAQDDCISDLDSSSIHASLQSRLSQLEQGVGKRYICRTQKGFLNIHHEPSDPFDTQNIVGILKEGQVVTSIGPSRGVWIQHDAGGWSIGKYSGFTWLEPFDE